MSAKETRDIIIAVIILLAGVRLLVVLSRSYIPQTASAFIPKDIFLSIDGLANLITVGLIIILLFCIPLYFSKRSEEKPQKL